MNKPTTPAALSAEERARMKRAALDAMDPKDRFAALSQLERDDMQRESLDIQRSQARMAQNADAPVAETVRQAGEAREVLCAERRTCFALLDVSHELAFCTPPARVTIRVKVQGHRCAAGETRTVRSMSVDAKGRPVEVETAEDIGGKHMISTLQIVDATEAETILLADVKRPFLGQLADLEARGDLVGLANLEGLLKGKGTEGLLGFLTRRWREITKPIHVKCIGQGPLESLLAREGFALVGEIELGDAPTGTEIKPANRVTR